MERRAEIKLGYRMAFSKDKSAYFPLSPWNLIKLNRDDVLEAVPWDFSLIWMSEWGGEVKE